MLNRKIIVTLFILFIITIGIIISIRNENKTEVIRIGVLSPLTGNFATLGEDFSKGVKIAAAENNNIEIIEEDTASDPKIAISAMNKLIGEGVKVFLAGPSSGINLALAPIAERNKVILIAQSKTKKLDDAGEYIYRASPLVDEEAKMMASILSQKPEQEIAVIFDNSSDTTISAKDVFISELSAVGGKVAVVEGFDGKSVKDFRTIITKLKSTPVKYVYLATAENPTGSLLKQILEMKWNIKLYGWSVHDTQRIVTAAGKEAIEGLVITAELFDCDRNELAAKYCNNYLSTTGSTTPQYYGAYAYDIVTKLSQLVEENSDVKELKNSLLNVDIQNTIVGSIKIDGKGNINKSEYILKTVKDGKFVRID